MILLVTGINEFNIININALQLFYLVLVVL